MKVDLYTKLVLTVIAACLLYIVGKDLSFVPTAYAQYDFPRGDNPQVVDVNIVSVKGRAFSELSVGGVSPGIPVKIIGSGI